MFGGISKKRFNPFWVYIKFKTYFNKNFTFSLMHGIIINLHLCSCSILMPDTKYRQNSKKVIKKERKFFIIKNDI